jgi:hypothetical protein
MLPTFLLESFSPLMQALSPELQTLREELTARLDRMESKLDGHAQRMTTRWDAAWGRQRSDNGRP